MVNTPIPHSLKSEAKKAAKILRDFTVPNAKSGPDKLIPAHIIARAKGLAILTVIKAGFLVTARAGSGIVIARVEDDRWSAPSAIGIAGLGGGFEIGAEMTDFVIILNSRSAVDAFSKGGNLTLGGNFTVAIGPLGRNLEGDVSVRSAAAIYTYSKTRGIFAGISIEGSALIERKDANRKFYGCDVRAYQILSGEVLPPQECSALYDVLSKHAEYAEEAMSRLAAKTAAKERRKQRERENESKARDARQYTAQSKTVHSTTRRRSGSNLSLGSSLSTTTVRTVTTVRKSASMRQTDKVRVQAIYDFPGQLPCDLSFKSGEWISVTLQTDTQDDWWEGTVNGKLGIFPANYVAVC